MYVQILILFKMQVKCTYVYFKILKILKYKICEIIAMQTESDHIHFPQGYQLIEWESKFECTKLYRILIQPSKFLIIYVKH